MYSPNQKPATSFFFKTLYHSHSHVGEGGGEGASIMPGTALTICGRSGFCASDVLEYAYIKQYKQQFLYA